MSEQEERRLPAHITEEDIRLITEVVTPSILQAAVEAGWRPPAEPEWEYVGEDSVYRHFTDKPNVAARWSERGAFVRKRTKAAPAGPWVPVEEQHAAG